MKLDLYNLLFKWPKPWIRDTDLSISLKGPSQARYDLVNRALKEGTLLRLKRGIYLIGPPLTKTKPNAFELAQVLYGPSYISLASSLSYHAWIPEGVHSTTSVSSKRSRSFETAIGHFEYSHTPVKNFYFGVERVQSNDATYLLASPWKALADYIYVFKKDWKNIFSLAKDLRIEMDTILDSDLDLLKLLLDQYHSKRVQKNLYKLSKELL